MDDTAERKQVAKEVALEEAALKAFNKGDRRVKLDTDTAYSAAMQLRLLRREKAARVYYQNIVYEVAVLLDAKDVGGTLITSGTVENPSTSVQDALRELIGRRVGGSRQDVVWLAMHQAVEAYGGEADGTFNAAGFSSCLMRIAGLKGVIDGNLVKAILAGRSDVEMLKPGDAHYKLLGER